MSSWSFRANLTRFGLMFYKKIAFLLIERGSVWLYNSIKLFQQGKYSSCSNFISEIRQPSQLIFPFCVRLKFSNFIFFFKFIYFTKHLKLEIEAHFFTTKYKLNLIKKEKRKC